MAVPDSPITEVDREESGPGTFWYLKGNQPIGPPQLLIPGVPQVKLGQVLVWGSPGIFSPDCLESPTPETYASGESLSSSVVLCRPDMELGEEGCVA